MVPYARLQSVRVVQGPLQRLLRLATVYGDTAGGRSGVAQDRDVAEAWWIAEQLSTRARQARAATPVPVPPRLAPQHLAPPHFAPQVPVPPHPASPHPASAEPGVSHPEPEQPSAPDDDTYWRRPPRP
jgi:putative membrane protein